MRDPSFLMLLLIKRLMACPYKPTNEELETMLLKKPPDDRAGLKTRFITAGRIDPP
jgi:hypothetical protein